MKEDAVLVVGFILWILFGPVFIGVMFLVVIVTQVYEYFRKRKDKP